MFPRRAPEEGPIVPLDARRGRGPIVFLDARRGRALRIQRITSAQIQVQTDTRRRLVTGRVELHQWSILEYSRTDPS